jgi:CheY-like chemotaxis protein
VADHLRQLGGRTIPVLVITADGHARERASQLGAYAYLRKPFELSDFTDAVQRGLDATH